MEVLLGSYWNFSWTTNWHQILDSVVKSCYLDFLKFSEFQIQPVQRDHVVHLCVQRPRAQISAYEEMHNL